MPQIVAVRDAENPRRMVEVEVFEDDVQGAKKARDTARRFIEEYGSEYDLYNESAPSVERFLQLKQVREWPDHLDIDRLG